MAMPGYRRTAKAVAAQVAQLKAGGCQKVFREVASGAKTDRNHFYPVRSKLCYKRV